MTDQAQQQLEQLKVSEPVQQSQPPPSNPSNSGTSEASGLKSWADIARPEGELQEDDIVTEKVVNEENNSGENTKEKQVNRPQKNKSNNGRKGGGPQKQQQQGPRGRLSPHQMKSSVQAYAIAHHTAMTAAQYQLLPTQYYLQGLQAAGSPMPPQNDPIVTFLNIFSQYPHLNIVNLPVPDTTPFNQSSYFVIHVDREQDMHRLVKYCTWVGKGNAVDQLVSGFGAENMHKMVCLFFYIKSTNSYAGFAQMTLPPTPVESPAYQSYFQAPLRWICVKDVVVSELSGIKLEKRSPPKFEEDAVEPLKPVTTIQPISTEVGFEAFEAYLNAKLATTLLMNFQYFDLCELTNYTVQDYVKRDNGRPSRGGKSGGNRGGYNRGGYSRGGSNNYNNRRSGRGGSGNRGGRGARPNNKFQEMDDRPREVLGSDGSRQQLKGAYQFEIKEKKKKNKQTSSAAAE